MRSCAAYAIGKPYYAMAVDFQTFPYVVSDMDLSAMPVHFLRRMPVFYYAKSVDDVRFIKIEASPNALAQ